MLNFLRKLRKKEMKGARYLKYAVGEILLVVIGILIALSVNNVNTKRINKQKEKVLLQQLEKDITSASTNPFKSLSIGIIKVLWKSF